MWQWIAAILGALCVVDTLPRGIYAMLHLVWKRHAPPSSPRRVRPFLPSLQFDRDHTGCLHVRAGPMFCGKTTWLLQEISRYADLNTQPPLLINSNKDTRAEKISSHSSQFHGISPKVVTVKTARLDEVDVSAYSVIGIDEAQFYPDLALTVYAWLLKGKQIYCAGLDGDYKMEAFGEIALLLPKAESFMKMTALCAVCVGQATPPLVVSSLSPAPFSARLSATPENGKTQVDIGGADKYIAVCRAHFTC